MIKKIIADTFQRKHLHLLVILSCVIMQMLTFGEAYRTFAYLNLLIVVYSLYSFLKSSDGQLSFSLSRNLFYFPIGFILLHLCAVHEVVMLKEIRHILLATSLLIGVAMLSQKSAQYLREKIYGLALIVISIYVFSQFIALYYFGRPYGTTKNPHYLAFYSAIWMIVSVFCFSKGAWLYKFIFTIYLLMLSFLLIQTGSRPAWIGLLVSALIVILFFLERHIKLKALAGLLVLLATLSITNIGGFYDRSKNLIQSIGQEERVTIWRDSWAMQMDSSPFEWVVGHGIDRFEDDFKPYSGYHQKQIDFNSPHNYFLEILYLSGALGLGLFLTMLLAFYQKIIRCINSEDAFKGVYVMLLSIFTTCFIFAGITLPFFNSKTMNMIAYLVGSIFYIKSISKKTA